QAEHGRLVDDVLRKFAQGSELVDRVGPGFLLRNAPSEPLEKLPLARDRNVVGFGLGEAVRGPSVVEKRPTQFADNEDVGLFCHPLARLAAVLSHQRERIGALHRGKPPREGDGAAKRRAISFSVLLQRPVFLFVAVLAPTRSLALGAAGFFWVSAPMLARSASIRLITRWGACASSRTGSSARPACFFLKSSTRAFSQ